MKTPPILLSAEGRTSLVDISAEIEICKFPFCYMKRDLKYQRILILFLLSLTVLAPIFFIPEKLAKFTRSFANKEFVEDISTFTFKHDSLKLSVLEQEIGEDLKEPERIVYKDGDIISVRKTFDDDHFTNKDAGSMGEDESSSERSGLEIDNGHERGFQNSTDAITRKIPVPSREKGQPSRTAGGELDVRSQNRKDNDEKLRVMKGQILMTKQGQPNRTADGEPAVRTQNKKANDGKLREMKDQIIMAKAYLNFAPPNSNSHLVRELKLRIKEVERAVGEATKDSDLHRSALQRMRSMEATLSKVGRVYSNCSPMASKLRAMTANTEEQFRAQKNQAQYLIELAARTFPKGLHCLSMKLTTDYFSLRPEEREISNKQKLQHPDLHHYALFSDNILACTVVVNSTVSSSMEPEKIVFHVVTDALNFPAITMWFLSNPPGEATIEVKILDDFKPPSTNGPILKQSNSRDLRFISPLNYLRFYLPELFPQLNKIVLLDHDVVVQRDLRQLWGVHMKGKVNGAVETCGDSDDDSSHRLDMFVNFSDPMVAKRFDAKACTWAFGLNVFDLQEWRKRDLTRVYHKWLQLGKKRQLWKAGSLPLGQVVFYNHTMSLDRRWHVLGLGGYDSGLQRGEIEKAAVIHYDGHMKPWLEIGIAKYKGYWNKFVPFDHPFLQQCNIHQ